MRLQTEIIKKRFMLFGFVIANMKMFFLLQHLTQKLLCRLQCKTSNPELGFVFYLRSTMTEKILILDFGSQYTQLIARAVREANVYCEIIPFQKEIEFEPGLKGIILSGSPFSVNDENAPQVNIETLIKKVPVLGVCYGAQLTAKQFGGRVEKSNKREYGRAVLQVEKHDVLLKEVAEESHVWMSHADTILEMPEGFELLATTDSIPVAAFKKTAGNGQPIFLSMVYNFIRRYIILMKAKKY